MKDKRCIFHIPNYIDPNSKSGSSLRPKKMIQGFKENGYIVDCVMGYGKERKIQIEHIKDNIRKGVKYDFLYAESSTMPTLLTEKNHVPRYPMLDFKFFKFCKAHNIRIGLFYRDIQWKFSVYKDNVSWYKKCISIPFYRYDLLQYKNLLDTFYLPTDEMKKYLTENDKLLKKTKILMPGCEDDKELLVKTEKIDLPLKPLKILYVGGIDRIYDLKIFVETVSQMREEVEVYICCRENEWKTSKGLYEPFMGENIKIIHKSGKELDDYYEKTDLCCAFAGVGEYMKMAMPVKIFEYLGKTIPIVATKGTAAGEFVENSGIGWSINYDIQSLKKCLKNIIQNPQVLEEKRKRELEIKSCHTWKARAHQVIEDLR